MPVRIGTLAFGIAFIAACGDDDGPTDPPQVPSSITVTTGSTPPPRFIPGVGKVAAGGTVTFINGSPVVHDFTTATGAWEATALEPDESFTVTLEEPGTYSYRCTIHAGMTGTITVE